MAERTPRRLQDSPMRTTPIRSAWTPSRMSDISSIDLQSPKIIAAAKVTGILIDELREPLPSNPSSPQPSEAEQRRREVMERKRLMLMQELEDTADNLDPLEIDNIVSGRNTPAWRGVDDNALYEREKSRIDRQRAKAMEELRREAMREMESQKASLEWTHDWEKKAERISEMQANKIEKVVKMREAKMTQAENNRIAVRMKRKEKHDQGVARIQAKQDRFASYMDELMRTRESNLEAKHDKDRDNIRKVVGRENQRFQENMRKNEEHAMRSEMLEEFLENRQAEFTQRQEQAMTDTQGKAQYVQESQQKAALAREKACTEMMERVSRAREQCQENRQQVSDKVRERREKQLNKWTQNRQAKITERRNWAAKQKQDLAASFDRRAAVSREYREQCSAPRVLTKSIYDELVQSNRERLQRVDEGLREQTINKIMDSKIRSESEADQRKQAEEYRVDVQRERWYGKQQIVELKECTKNASPDQLRGTTPSRLTAILQDLGVTMPEPRNEKEGDEEEQQRK